MLTLQGSTWFVLRPPVRQNKTFFQKSLGQTRENAITSTTRISCVSQSGLGQGWDRPGTADAAKSSKSLFRNHLRVAAIESVPWAHGLSRTNWDTFGDAVNGTKNSAARMQKPRANKGVKVN